MKIGIITQPLLSNYGGVLQNFALQSVLKKLNKESITIDYIYNLPFYRYLLSLLKTVILRLFGRKRPFAKKEKRNKLFNKFIQNYVIKTKRVDHFSSVLLEKNNIDVLIVGSDQVWRPKYNHKIEDVYLKFAEKMPVKRIAYAASFGVDEWEYSLKQTEDCSDLAKKFDAISVREESGVKLCKEHLGIDATWVLDPTLLLDKEDYNEVCKEVPVAKENFLAAYVLDKNDAIRAQCESIAAEHGLTLKYFEANSSATLSVPEWLAMFRDASFVVTDSFHGTVFAILFSKEFKCLYNKSRGSARFDSLLKLYESGKLDEMREFSLNWLKNVLEKK